MAEYPLDKRTFSELQEEIKRLAGAYTPQWRYGMENPDMGSVIAAIFAEQSAENIQRYNELLERYEDELMNMVSLEPGKAQPAEAVVVIKAVPEGIREADVPRGSRFYGKHEGKETPVVFENIHDLHVTNAKITEILAVSGMKGQVREYGAFQDLTFPMYLFDTAGSAYENELHVFHSYLFSEEGREIVLDTGDADAAEKLCDDTYCRMFWKMGPRIKETFPQQDGRKIRLTGAEGAKALLIQSRETIRETLFLPDLVFSTGTYDGVLQFVSDGVRELKGEELAVFGEDISMYGQCFLGLQEELVHSGVKVRIEAEFTYRKREFFNILPKEEELKMIKRAPKEIFEGETAQVYVTETDFSYYNGRGFRSLDCNTPGGIFAGETDFGKMILEFECPEDMEMLELGGWKGYALKLQVMRADNCYMRPAVHHCPVLKNLKVSYTFDGAILPEKVIRRHGKTEEDFTSYVKEHRPLPALAAFPYRGESMYFGFQRKPEGGPVSLYLVLPNQVNYQRIELTFSYSGEEGFAPLRVMDSTKNLTMSGIFAFFPPEDMCETEVEGKRAYWLRIEASGEETLPEVKIQNLYMNGVRVRNTDGGICDGVIGNVEAMAIDRLGLKLLAVEAVYNPLEASGGTDEEGKERLSLRSSVFLGTAGRLVTVQDYVRTAEMFAENIAQVEGRVQNSQMVLAVLMKDYENGKDSFRRIQEPLRQYLKGPAQVVIREPVFVKVSVKLWVEAVDVNAALEEKADLLWYIRESLSSPRIGQVLEEEPFVMQLRSRMTKLRLLCHQITVSYRDGEKENVKELKDIMREPFVLCVNGHHEIVIM